ncbi:MAG: ROK family transcriptional regulator [Lachnoclostridium sp.]|jgi:predicted NBD/HSP70 family sugar kinase|nr:ROK family transcriptional regulator [Lachnoclostridium sp.]
MKIDHGLNQESVQDMNRTLLINLLRKEGVCSRVHLAKMSLLKQATVTNIINDFIQWGLVKEVGFLVGDKGRRSIGISINNDDFYVIGIRLARKNYTIGIFDLSGNMMNFKRVELGKSQQPRETFGQMIKDSKDLVFKTKKGKAIGIGMALPGPYSVRRQRIELMTGVFGWNEISIRDELSNEFKLPVFIEQDANSGAVAQYWHNGEHYKKDTLVYIAVGQGVGSGIISNGELIKGCIGVAGEIGHMSIQADGPQCACGNKGCLEMYCSSIAFMKQVNERLGGTREYKFSEAVEMIKEEHPEVLELYKKCCDYLAVGIVNVINSFNPSVIVLGDEMLHAAPDIMLAQVKEKVESRILPEIYSNTEIVASVVQNDSMVHGAAIMAIKDIFRRPNDYF